MVLDYRMRLDEREGSQEAFAGLFGREMQDVGFARLSGHGISPALINDVYAIARELFLLPLEIKRLYHHTWWGAQRGFAGGVIQPEVYGGTAKEAKEMLTVGRRHGPHPLFMDYPVFAFPRELPDAVKKHARVIELFDALEEIFRELVLSMAVYFKVDPEKLLRKKFRHLIDSMMRLLFYPVGAGGNEHFDTGMLTLMLAPTAQGLEIKNRRGLWETFQSEVGELIVNTGKLIAFIINMLLGSVVLEPREHRVLAALREQVERESLPFFGWTDPYHPIGDGRLAWEFLRDDLTLHGFWPPSTPRPNRPFLF